MLREVAPKPDPRTGHPRPPRAPVLRDLNWAADKNRENQAKYPTAPNGRGPVLEWWQERASTSTWAGVLVSGLVVLFLCIKDWGIAWMWTIPWLWVFVAIPPVIWYFIGRRVGISAGADWFAVKGGYVDTYELTDVKVSGSSGGLAWDLELKDKSANEVSINLREIQANRDLWDLVYNGILHGAHYSSTKIETNAINKLKLR